MSANSERLKYLRDLNMEIAVKNEIIENNKQNYRDTLCKWALDTIDEINIILASLETKIKVTSSEISTILSEISHVKKELTKCYAYVEKSQIHILLSSSKDEEMYLKKKAHLTCLKIGELEQLLYKLTSAHKFLIYKISVNSEPIQKNNLLKKELTAWKTSLDFAIRTNPVQIENIKKQKIHILIRAFYKNNPEWLDTIGSLLKSVHIPPVLSTLIMDYFLY